MTTTPDELFRTWLARIVAERRLSRGQLAMRAGIDRSTVSRILSGERGPTLDTALRLIRAFDDGSMPPMLARLKRAGDLTSEVEDALRRDPGLSSGDRAEVMRFYQRHRQADARDSWHGPSVSGHSLASARAGNPSPEALEETLEANHPFNDQRGGAARAPRHAGRGRARR